jgi:hypothetical protein
MYTRFFCHVYSTHAATVLKDTQNSQKTLNAHTHTHTRTQANNHETSLVEFITGQKERKEFVQPVSVADSAPYSS